jgi:hypothetical protein
MLRTRHNLNATLHRYGMGMTTPSPPALIFVLTFIGLSFQDGGLVVDLPSLSTANADGGERAETALFAVSVRSTARVIRYKIHRLDSLSTTARIPPNADSC